MKYGKIEKEMFLREAVGECSFKLDNGKEVSCELNTTIKKSPMVSFGGKHFHISWEDIMHMAIDAGLFNDEEKGESDAKD